MSRPLRARYGRPVARVRAVAYHEAGHIVAAEHLGLRVRRFSWRPKRELTFEPTAGDDALVRALRTKRLAPELHPFAQAHLLCTLAGREAELLATGKAPKHPFDARQAGAFTRMLEGGGDRRATVRGWLLEHWPAVEAVAALIEATPGRALSGDELRSAM